MNKRGYLSVPATVYEMPTEYNGTISTTLSPQVMPIFINWNQLLGENFIDISLK